VYVIDIKYVKGKYLGAPATELTGSHNTISFLIACISLVWQVKPFLMQVVFLLYKNIVRYSPYVNINIGKEEFHFKVLRGLQKKSLVNSSQF
jgi:hypothetical protein